MRFPEKTSSQRIVGALYTTKRPVKPNFVSNALSCRKLQLAEQRWAATIAALPLLLSKIAATADKINGDYN
jgi:hypothetical protein